MHLAQSHSPPSPLALQICKAGKCVLDVDENGVRPHGSSVEKQGIVIVELLNGKVPQRDNFSPSDTYVKLFIQSPSQNESVSNSSDSKLDTGKFATSKVIWDTNEPSFGGQTFKVEKVPISSTLVMMVYDKDRMNQDDYIATVYIAVKSVLSEGINHKPHTLFFPPGGDYFINCTISWIGM